MKNAVSLIIILMMLAGLAAYADEEAAGPFVVGLKAFNEGKYVQALSNLSDAVKAYPDDPVRLITLGIALANSRRYDEAITQFRRITSLLPNDPVAYYLLEGAYLAKGETSRATGQDGKVQDSLLLGDEVPPPGTRADLHKHVTSGAGELERRLAAFPDSAITQNLLGDMCQVRGNYADALVHYQRATELAPKWVKPWFNLGMANLSINPSEAAKNFKKVLELDPGNRQAELWLGDAYAEQSDYRQALESYSNASNSRELEPMARSRIGNIYLKQNQPEKAEQEFRRATEQSPHDPVAATGLGEALQQQQKLDESVKEYKRAVELTRAAPTQQAIVVPNLANAYIAKGDYKKAIDELKGVVSIKPDMDSVNKLIDAYRLGGLLQQGISEYEMVLKQQPNNPVAMRFLVIAYAYSGNAAGRAEMARKLLKLAPEETMIWKRELGCALISLGNREAAIQAWKEGLEFDPLFDSAGILRAAQIANAIGDLLTWYEKQAADGKAAVPLLILASIHEYNGNFSIAAEVRRKLADVYPEKHHYWILLGDDLLRAGDVVKAKAAYARAAAMEDGDLQAIAQDRLRSIK